MCIYIYIYIRGRVPLRRQKSSDAGARWPGQLGVKGETICHVNNANDDHDNHTNNNNNNNNNSSSSSNNATSNKHTSNDI